MSDVRSELLSLISSLDKNESEDDGRTTRDSKEWNHLEGKVINTGCVSEEILEIDAAECLIVNCSSTALEHQRMRNG